MINNQPKNSKPDLTDDELKDFCSELYNISGMDVNLMESIPLSDISKKESIWDKQRIASEKVARVYDSVDPEESYAKNGKFGRLVERMDSCSTLLKFGFSDGFKLKNANFCRVRNCPVCRREIGRASCRERV